MFDKIIIEQHENYIKQSYRNRCEIYGANGKLTLSVPVQKNHNRKTTIADTKISYDTNWVKLHLKSIESAYRSAPFYEYYIDDVQKLIESKPIFLLDFNTKIVHKFLEFLELNTVIEYSKKYEKESIYNDYREQIHPKIIYQKADNNFIASEYYQVFSDKHKFIPNLSILDLLFNMGPESRQLLKKCISI
ncbi:MAG: WbqC family protein [Chlorobi bacterium]|nr:WbqC family protein [Chlorobiota bacterium]